jgi:uncharacterized DUF497 family protein
VQYEWNNGKAAENLRKHRVDFADAIAALEDTNRLEEIDTRFDYGEERIQVIGMGPRPRAGRGRDANRRRHLQNHIGSEGHAT